MKIQIYPVIKSEAYESEKIEIDPVTKMIDDFFKKDVDNEKITCYNNYIK